MCSEFNALLQVQVTKTEAWIIQQTNWTLKWCKPHLQFVHHSSIFFCCNACNKAGRMYKHVCIPDNNGPCNKTKVFSPSNSYESKRNVQKLHHEVRLYGMGVGYDPQMNGLALCSRRRWRGSSRRGRRTSSRLGWRWARSPPRHCWMPGLVWRSRGSLTSGPSTCQGFSLSHACSWGVERFCHGAEQNKIYLIGCGVLRRGCGESYHSLFCIHTQSFTHQPTPPPRGWLIEGDHYELWDTCILHLRLVKKMRVLTEGFLRLQSYANQTFQFLCSIMKISFVLSKLCQRGESRLFGASDWPTHPCLTNSNSPHPLTPPFGHH